MKRLKFVKFELSKSIFRLKHIVFCFFEVNFLFRIVDFINELVKNILAHFASEKTLFSKITPNFCRPKSTYFKNYAIRLTKCVRAGALEKIKTNVRFSKFKHVQIDDLQMT